MRAPLCSGHLILSCLKGVRKINVLLYVHMICVCVSLFVRESICVHVCISVCVLRYVWNMTLLKLIATEPPDSPMYAQL